MCLVLIFCLPVSCDSICSCISVSAKSAPKLLGDEECTMGPSYWCKDYKTAKQCGAVKYCTEHKWLKQIKGSTCDECKTIVAGIHAYLADNITEVKLLISSFFKIMDLHGAA